jgi:hypothetical protein
MLEPQGLRMGGEGMAKEKETEQREEVEFWTQKTACDPAEAALELRMEVTSGLVLVFLFLVFALCCIAGLFFLPQEDKAFYTWAEVITALWLLGVMMATWVYVSKKKGNLRQMEAQLAKK